MSTADVLRAHAPHAPDDLRARVLAAGPAPGRRRRVRPVLVLAAAAALAVAAAVVHGFTTSGPARTPDVTTTPAFGRALSPVHLASGGTGAAAVRQALPPHAVAVPSPSPNRLAHTDASIRVRVGSADELGVATTRATRIASSLGGYAQSVLYRTPQGGGGASFLELRVPAERVKQALAQLAGLGTLVSQQISIQDLTAQLQRQSAQIAELRRRVAALEAALRNPPLPEGQRVLLQLRLAESKRALAERLHGRKGTLAAGATSRISLVLTTQTHAVVVPHHRGRLGRMLHSALGFLAIEGMVALFALIVASPLAVAVGLLWLWRRRAVDRLLME